MLRMRSSAGLRSSKKVLRIDRFAARKNVLLRQQSESSDCGSLVGAHRPIIGIVGGVGPAAGLLLHRKIIENTLAHNDSDHLDVLHVSMPSHINDRTDYLLHRDHENPAVGAFSAIESLADSLSGRPLFLGVPCNTFHSQPIFNSFELLLSTLPHVHLINMVRETVSFLKSRYPTGTRVGYLSSTGTRLSHVYDDALQRSGFCPKTVPLEQQSLVHESIYNEEWGIKALSRASSESRSLLEQAMESLVNQGAECILLACTELPIVLRDPLFRGSVPLIDPMDVLARLLIRHANGHLVT